MDGGGGRRAAGVGQRPAQQLQAQGVAGEDFVDLTAQVMQTDLRLSPFTARKLVRIRDAYLMGP